MRIKIAGTGRALPQKVVPSSEWDASLGLEHGHLGAATGVVTRYVCDGENQIDLAVTACRAALADAGLSAGDIGLVIGAQAVPYQPIPATAPLVMQRLGFADGQAAGFDVNATCLSFVTALEQAAMAVDGGRVAAALVFSSEVASRALPWDSQPEIAALFGDGAGAAVITRADRGGIAATLMRTFPSGFDDCGIGAGGTRIDYHNAPDDFASLARFQMDGRRLFRLTSVHFCNFVNDLLERAGWSIADVDLVVPHQASPLALGHMIRQTGFAADRVVNVAAGVGNQIAASIPFALDVARRDGRMAGKVLLLGTSAGVSFGGLALEVA